MITIKIIDKIFKLFSNIILIVVVILLIIVVYGNINKIVTKKDYADYFGYTFFEVASGSMAPAININDLVVVKIGVQEFDVGDIVTYQDENTFITHRIISIDGDTFITKGDANDSNDKIINKSIIVGKVNFIFPDFGIYRASILDPRVLISVGITFALFSVYFALKDKEQESSEQVNNDV